MKASYTNADIAQALKISRQAAFKRAAKEGWSFQERPNPKGGKPIKEYAYTSLPKEVQKALETWELGRVVEEGKALGAIRSAQSAVEKGKGSGSVAVGGQSIILTPWQERQALAKADLLRLYREAAGRAKWGEVMSAKLNFLEAYNRGRSGPFPQLYEILGPITYKTVERWAVKAREALRAGGDLIRTLASKHGNHLRGRRRIGEREGKLEDLMRTPQGKILLAWALSPNRYNKAQVIANARSAMRSRGIPDNESDITYRRFLDDFEACKNHIWVYSREGKSAWNDQCAFYIERDYDLLEVGDCLVADGHTFNFESINPYTGKPKRLTLITFMDMKSNFICGWEIMPTENTRSIAAALRRACLALGKLPLCVYLDNGKAFGAKYFTGDLKESGLGGLFKRLGIETIFAWPYHGQSKTLERWHLTLKEFERHAPTYVGGSIGEKPPRMNRGEREHRKMWERLTRGAVPTLLQTHQALASWLDERYHSRPQPKGHLKGKSPLEVFLSGKGQGIDPGELRYLMLSQTVRTIHRRGITHLGKDYYAPELYGRKHRVMIRYDLLDPDYILVYEEDGTYLCEARVMSKVHPIARITGTETHQEELKRQIELKKHQEKEASVFCRWLSETLVEPETAAHFARLGLSGGHSQVQLGNEKETTAPLDQRELAKIEAEAGEVARKMQAEAERREELKQQPDCQRYLALLAHKARGGKWTLDERRFVYYFRRGEEYAELREWFEAQDLEFVCRAGQKETSENYEDPR